MNDKRSETEQTQAEEGELAILYFGNDWFAENRTSSHHVARQLARTHRICYVECPGLRAPKSSGRDIRKLFRKLWRFVRGAVPAEDNVNVLTLPQVPLHRFRLIRELNRRLGVWTLRWYMWRHGIKRPVSWFVVPHVGHLSGMFNERLSVYYCIDDYSALPDIDAESIRQMDDQLTRRADVVFVASETLLEKKRLLNPQVFHSPHGVDVEHFAAASRSTAPIPQELAALKKPVVGFFGLIESWIDLDLVGWLAQQRPQYSFVMIGRVAVPEAAVPQSPNLHFLGRRPYEDLPDYGRGFDCCLIPYRMTRQVLHANPLKLREYLAMGKPIVAVSTPEIDQFADVVKIAPTREEFLAKLDETLASPDSPADVERRLTRVRPMSWSSRVAAVWEKVAQAIQDKLNRDSARTSSHSLESTAAAPR